MTLSTLIADDEPHARRYLKNLLDKEESVGMVYECKNGKEVLEFFKHKEPDVVFLDINMPGITGIEVATKLKESTSLIIFSTAYDQYAIKAFELEAFDYLLKPFDEKRFGEVMQRAKKHIEINKQADFSKKFADIYQEYSQSVSPYLTEFVIKERGFSKSIKAENIAYIESSSIYAVLHTAAGKQVLYRVALNLLEQQLPPAFFRIHRSFIVNKNHIDSCKYLNNSTYEFSFSTGETITSSRKYQEVIEKRMGEV